MQAANEVVPAKRMIAAKLSTMRKNDHPSAEIFQNLFGFKMVSRRTKKERSYCSSSLTEMEIRHLCVHQSLGRQPAKDFYKSRRLLKEGVEKLLAWRCDILQRAGLLQSLRDVRDLAAIGNGHCQSSMGRQASLQVPSRGVS